MHSIHHSIRTLVAAVAFIGFSQILAGHNRELVIITEFGQYETVEQTLTQKKQESPRPYGIGAASNLFLNALYQEVPILAPGPLVGNIAEHKRIFDNITTTKSIDTLYKLYRSYPRFQTAPSIQRFKYLCSFGKKALSHMTHLIKNGCDPQTLKEKIDHDPVFKVPASLPNSNEAEWLELSLYLQCFAAPIDRYEIRIIYPDEHPEMPWYLFLPKSLLKDLSHNEQSSESEKFSALEKSLGLALKNLDRVDNPFSIHQDTTHSKEYPKHFLPLLQKLFITREKLSSAALPAWTIYMMGHGINCEESKILLAEEKKKLSTTRDQVSRDEGQEKIEKLEYANKVCCLPTPVFTNLLTFLNEEVSTHLFFYSSCSAGGKQAIDSFCLNGKQLKLNYPVIADTLQEARSINVTPIFLINLLNSRNTPDDLKSLIDWKKRELILKTPYDFYSFFALAKSDNATSESISHLISTLCPVFRCSDSLKKRNKGAGLKDSRVISSLHAFVKRSAHTFDREDIINLPTIRLPQANSFALIDGAGTFLELSGECARTKAPLCIPSDKEILVVSTPTISTPIMLADNKIPPYVISMIPGAAYHEIDQISGTSASFEDIVGSFFVCDEISVCKGYHIKKLTCLDNVFTHKVQTFENVFLFMSVNHNDVCKSGVVFEHKGELLASLWNNQNPPPDTVKKDLTKLSDEELDALCSQFDKANQHVKKATDNQLIISPATVSHTLSNNRIKV